MTAPLKKQTNSKQRASAARERVAAQRRAEAQKAKRRRQVVVSSAVVAVLAVIAVVGILIASKKNSHPVTASSTPPNVTSTNGINVGAASAPVLVDLYEDFRCPVCETFEKSTGSLVNTLVKQDKIKLQYHLLSFIDDNLGASKGGNYSKRTANALACTAADPAKVQALHAAFYASQPTEAVTPPNNAGILTVAATAGLSSPQFASCVTNDTYKNWVLQTQDKADKRGVTGTPTVLVNGKILDVTAKTYTPTVFSNAVAAAAAARS